MDRLVGLGAQRRTGEDVLSADAHRVFACIHDREIVDGRLHPHSATHDVYLIGQQNSVKITPLEEAARHRQHAQKLATLDRLVFRDMQTDNQIYSSQYFTPSENLTESHLK